MFCWEAFRTRAHGLSFALDKAINFCLLIPHLHNQRDFVFNQREDFWNEAIKLADLHHPNVVAFYGVVLDGPGGSVATVTEYMVNGSLRNALQKNEK